MADEHLSAAGAARRGEDGGGRGGGDYAYAWPAVILCFVAVLAIIVLATGAGMAGGALFDRLTGSLGPRSYAAGEREGLVAARLAFFLAIFQIAAVVLAALAGRGLRRADGAPLALAAPMGGIVRAAGYGILLVGLAAFFTSIVYSIDRNALLNDLLLFRDMLATRMWWAVALAAVIGAPIAEELLFRGLMYGVLRASPVGAVGGAIVTSLVWASIHAQYTIYGVTAIFMIGLYLAWVRERTGSVIAPMICHAIYNGAVLSVLLFAPDQVLQPG